MAPMHTDQGGPQGDSGPSYLPRSEAGAGFPPHRTALLVIDPVNDLLSEGGAAWDLTATMVKMNDVIGHLRRAIEAAREWRFRSCSARWRTPRGLRRAGCDFTAPPCSQPR